MYVRLSSHHSNALCGLWFREHASLSTHRLLSLRRQDSTDPNTPSQSLTRFAFRPSYSSKTYHSDSRQYDAIPAGDGSHSRRGSGVPGIGASEYGVGAEDRTTNHRTSASTRHSASTTTSTSSYMFTYSDLVRDESDDTHH